MTRLSSTPMCSTDLSKTIVPFCPICNRSVPLENAKTDDYGRAVHEECYLLSVKLKLESGD